MRKKEVVVCDLPLSPSPKQRERERERGGCVVRLRLVWTCISMVFLAEQFCRVGRGRSRWRPYWFFSATGGGTGRSVLLPVWCFVAMAFRRSGRFGVVA
ncbi:hypothetical protein HAX54_002843 [Datura stramonium]|uniref:Transmembrane protein n=1 Tax=Datura stramonium TaxID=4076 RepID=A0ABS8WWI3_DATST|nr:hypothetical protein [Datura stramonium]